MKCTAGRLQVFAERGCGIWFLHESLKKKVNDFAAELRGIKK